VLAFACFLAAEAMIPSTAQVVAEVANIRQGPSASAPAIGELERGDQVGVTGCLPDCSAPDGWVLIAGDGAVARRALAFDGGDEFVPARASFVYGRVRDGGAVVYDAPSPTARRRGYVRAGHDLAFRRDDGLRAAGWLVRARGGFIRAERLRMAAPSPFRGIEPSMAPLVLRDRTVEYVRRRPREIAPTEKWVYVDLARQLLTAYEGDRLVYVTLVSTGRPPHPMLTGHFRVWYKAIHSPMHGEPDDPYYADRPVLVVR
jgi:hypothetical protein